MKDLIQKENQVFSFSKLLVICLILAGGVFTSCNKERDEARGKLGTAIWAANRELPAVIDAGMTCVSVVKKEDDDISIRYTIDENYYNISQIQFSLVLQKQTIITSLKMLNPELVDLCKKAEYSITAVFTGIYTRESCSITIKHDEL